MGIKRSLLFGTCLIAWILAIIEQDDPRFSTGKANASPISSSEEALGHGLRGDAGQRELTKRWLIHQGDNKQPREASRGARSEERGDEEDEEEDEEETEVEVEVEEEAEEEDNGPKSAGNNPANSNGPGPGGVLPGQQQQVAVPAREPTDKPRILKGWGLGAGSWILG